MAQELNIDTKKTAVVVIDLQKGITSMPTEPYPAKTVIENTSKILNAARAKSNAFCASIGVVGSYVTSKDVVVTKFRRALSLKSEGGPTCVKAFLFVPSH